MPTSAAGSKVQTVQTKEQIRICHLADLHLGYRRYNKITKEGLNQREVDVNQAFSESVSRIIALKPNLTVIAGDLFHHVRPSNLVLAFSFREIRRLAAGTKAPVVIISGNHDAPKRADTGCALRLFAEIPGVYVADNKARTFDFEDIGVSVYCLPHPALLELDQLTVRANDSYRYNILVIHAQVDEKWVSDFGGVNLDLRKVSQNEWDYIALGHVHMQREVSLNAAYSGATEHTASNIWSEADINKGFLEVHLPTGKKTFHALSSPREVVILEAVDAAGLEPDDVMAQLGERLESIAGGMDGKIIRLEVVNLSREILRQLNHKQLREWRARCMNLSLEVKAPVVHSGLNFQFAAPGGRIQDELSGFCEEFEGLSTDKQNLKKILTGYLKKTEGEDEASQSQP